MADVGRDGPRRRGPDQAVNVASGERGIDRRRIGCQRKPHPDGRAGVILIFDFSFGQRGAIVDAPVHGLQTFIDVAAVQEFDERARDHRLILRAHGEIRILPAPQNTQPDEIGALQIDVFCGVLAALGADLRRGHLRFARTQFAVDLDLDGQAVAIPAGNVGRIVALHGLELDDEILQDFVERVAQMNVAVGVRRPVVQHVHGTSGARGANLRVQILRVPAKQRLRLHLSQIRLHWEIGPG